MKKKPQVRAHLVDLHTSSGHDFPRALEWAFDSAAVALGTADGEVFIWGVPEGAVKAVLKLSSAVCALKWNPTQPILAVTCEDGLCRLVDINGRVLNELPISSRGLWAEHLAWFADGQLLVASAGKQARVFSLKGEPILETEVHPSTVTGVAVLRDGRAIVTACYGGARLWPLKAGEPSRLLPFQGSLISLSVSPDSSVVACGSQDASVHFWRLGDGKDSEMTGYPAKPRELAWSDDSRLLATGGGQIICVWNFSGSGPEGTSPLQLKGHEDLISDLHFASSRRWLASGSRDHDVLLWLPDEGPKPVGIAPMKAPVTHVRFDQTAHFLAAADEQGNWSLWKRVTEN